MVKDVCQCGHLKCYHGDNRNTYGNGCAVAKRIPFSLGDIIINQCSCRQYVEREGVTN